LRQAVLEYVEVDMIGQTFADEVFRAFANKHPDIELMHMRATSAVRRIILRVTK
jgi:hypothetical protein